MRRKKALPVSPIVADIDALSHDGRGIATVEGKKVFIFGALPGEQVSFKLTASKKSYDEGEVIELLNQPSPLRVAPSCIHFGQCGGCNLQHLKSEAALKHKEAVVLDNLLHMGKVTPECILPALVGPTEHYRRKARLGVRYVLKKESLLVGFRERTSHRIAIMDSCKTLDARVSELIPVLKQTIRSLSCFNAIAQIEVATSEERVVLVVRHLQALNDSDKAILIRFAEQYQAINLEIYAQPQGPESVYKLYPLDQNFLLNYQLDDLSFQFHPLDFVQVNATMNQKMVLQALKLLDCQLSDTVLDLFCGLGNFTLPIAKQVKSVVGVEGALTSIHRAKANAQLNGCHNVQFYVKDLSSALDHNDTVWTHINYNKIILDPPRTGAKEIVDAIDRWSSDTILYIACNPATLARDAHILVHQKNYSLKTLGIIDMFPHTAHIETMALFKRTKINK